MAEFIRLFAVFIRAVVRDRADLVAENLVLRNSSRRLRVDGVARDSDRSTGSPGASCRVTGRDGASSS